MRSLLVIGVMAVLVVGLTTGASAEVAFRGQVGASFSSDQEVTGENPESSAFTDIEIEDSVAVGAGAIYWLDNFPYIGLEGSIQLWFPDIDEQVVRNKEDNQPFKLKSEVDALSFGLLGMVRYPFGQFVPYGGGGMTFTHLDFNKTKVDQLDVRMDDDLFPTVTVKAGLTFYFTPNMGVFVEYKYINKHYDTTIGLDGKDPRNLGTVEIDMDTQFVEGGFEWRFHDPFAP